MVFEQQQLMISDAQKSRTLMTSTVVAAVTWSSVNVLSSRTCQRAYLTRAVTFNSQCWTAAS